MVWTTISSKKTSNLSEGNDLSVCLYSVAYSSDNGVLTQEFKILEKNVYTLHRYSPQQPYIV